MILQAGVPGGEQRPGAGPGPRHGGEAGQAAAGAGRGHRGRGGGGVLRPRVRADTEMIVTSCILYSPKITSALPPLPGLQAVPEVAVPLRAVVQHVVVVHRQLRPAAQIIWSEPVRAIVRAS